jgi:alpha/beta superfamily hydrolase
MKNFFLNGDAGRIEVWRHDPPGDAVGACLCLHPHPLHGGNLHNKVLYEARKALVDAGQVCYSLNFRGVGLSEGEFDYGEGEKRDAAVLDGHIRAEHPDLPVMLLGYSFGSWVGLRLAVERSFTRAFTVGLPVTVFDFSFLRGATLAVTAFQGEFDETGRPDEVRRVFQGWYPALVVVPVPGADHFFAGALASLRRVVEQAAAVV